MKFAPVLLSLGLGVAMTACGSSGLDSDASGGAAATTATNQADHACRIVTRTAERSTRNGSPYEASTDASGFQWFVWRGEVDVASADATATGTKVMVTWSHNVESDQGVWFTAEATAVDGAGAGYQRYEFALTHDTFGVGDDGHTFTELEIDFIPYLQLDGGARLYDHNRTDGNYSMNSASRYGVGEDASVCPATASAPDAG